ncbi:unnamed protein product, partial [Notodromas monacha]
MLWLRHLAAACHTSSDPSATLAMKPAVTTSKSVSSMPMRTWRLPSTFPDSPAEDCQKSACQIQLSTGHNFCTPKIACQEHLHKFQSRIHNGARIIPPKLVAGHILEPGEPCLVLWVLAQDFHKGGPAHDQGPGLDRRPGLFQCLLLGWRRGDTYSMVEKIERVEDSRRLTVHKIFTRSKRASDKLTHILSVSESIRLTRHLLPVGHILEPVSIFGPSHKRAVSRRRTGVQVGRSHWRDAVFPTQLIVRSHSPQFPDYTVRDERAKNIPLDDDDDDYDEDVMKPYSASPTKTRGTIRDERAKNIPLDDDDDYDDEDVMKPYSASPTKTRGTNKVRTNSAYVNVMQFIDLINVQQKRFIDDDVDDDDEGVGSCERPESQMSMASTLTLTTERVALESTDSGVVDEEPCASTIPPPSSSLNSCAVNRYETTKTVSYVRKNLITNASVKSLSSSLRLLQHTTPSPECKLSWSSVCSHTSATVVVMLMRLCVEVQVHSNGNEPEGQVCANDCGLKLAKDEKVDDILCMFLTSSSLVE